MKLEAAMFLCFCLLACQEDTSRKAMINDLQIQFLSGFIDANLGPVVPPDPIRCQIELQLRNANATERLIGISLPSAQVYVDLTSQILGEIQFSTEWQGNLIPGEQDTVKLTKISLEEAPFDPPCRQFVYLDIVVTNGANESKVFSTDSLFFNCTH